MLLFHRERFDVHFARYPRSCPPSKKNADWVRTGELDMHNIPVRKRQVKAYIRAVGQTIAQMGACDPRHSPYGNTDFRLYQQLRFYQLEDPLPGHVKPIPTPVLLRVYQSSVRGNTHQQCLADMLWIGFFFLLQPGEYCNTGFNKKSTPFCLQDITF